MERVTTLPAPITVFFPIVTPGNNIAPPPIHTPSSILTGRAIVLQMSSPSSQSPTIRSHTSVECVAVYICTLDALKTLSPISMRWLSTKVRFKSQIQSSSSSDFIVDVCEDRKNRGARQQYRREDDAPAVVVRVQGGHPAIDRNLPELRQRGSRKASGRFRHGSKETTVRRRVGRQHEETETGQCAWRNEPQHRTQTAAVLCGKYSSTLRKVQIRTPQGACTRSATGRPQAGTTCHRVGEHPSAFPDRLKLNNGSKHGDKTSEQYLPGKPSNGSLWTKCICLVSIRNTADFGVSIRNSACFFVRFKI